MNIMERIDELCKQRNISKYRLSQITGISQSAFSKMARRIRGGSMIKKKMILADYDERYLKELAYFFMERVPQLELVTFTKKEKMYQYLEQGNVIDILVVDEMLAVDKLKDLTPDVTRIAMSMSMSVFPALPYV